MGVIKIAGYHATLSQERPIFKSFSELMFPVTWI